MSSKDACHFAQIYNKKGSVSAAKASAVTGRFGFAPMPFFLLRVFGGADPFFKKGLRRSALFSRHLIWLKSFSAFSLTPQAQRKSYQKETPIQGRCPSWRNLSNSMTPTTF
jgi:hypothetical protein